MNHDLDKNHILNQSVILPCGAIIKNRLAKSAMSDSLANGNGKATQAHARLYERWAQNDVALSIIGEVQGSFQYPEKPGNIVLNTDKNQEKMRELAKRGTINGAHLWVQLGHGGALSHALISQPKGPSALKIDGFQCDEMGIDEIKALPLAFAKTAKLAQQAGFSGIQVHAAHGFLLSQFLSPLFNRRSDMYGGSIEARCKIIIDVITQIRKTVGSKFPIGIKINSSDQLESGLTEDDALNVIRMLDGTSVDLIEISGGTYFPGVKSSSDRKGSGAYFIEFAQRAKEITQIPVMVTGGFKYQAQAIEAITGSGIDVIGLARAFIINPQLAKDWLNNKNVEPIFPRFQATPPGGITAWYTLYLSALAEDNEDSFKLDLESAIQTYEERDAKRCITWNTYT